MPMSTGVSDAAYLCQQQDIPVQDLRQEESFGHSSVPYEHAEWLAQGFAFGYSLGVDGELLPPRWLRVAR